MKPASVIIMDEHPIVRMSIRVLLEKNNNIQVVLKTDDSRTAIGHLRTYSIDLVILDIELPGSNGFTLLKRIESLQGSTQVLFLPSRSESFYARRAIRAGTNGFVNERRGLNDIYNVVKMISPGCPFSPSDTLNFISNMNMKRGVSDNMPLSNREVIVLRYLANGLSNKEIVKQLLLSNETISAHKVNTYVKLGLHIIVELIDYAKTHELT